MAGLATDHTSFSGLSQSLEQLSLSRVIMGMGSSGLGLLVTVIINGR